MKAETVRRHLEIIADYASPNQGFTDAKDRAEALREIAREAHAALRALDAASQETPLDAAAPGPYRQGGKVNYYRAGLGAFWMLTGILGGWSTPNRCDIAFGVGMVLMGMAVTDKEAKP